MKTSLKFAAIAAAAALSIGLLAGCGGDQKAASSKAASAAADGKTSVSYTHLTLPTKLEV